MAKTVKIEVDDQGRYTVGLDTADVGDMVEGKPSGMMGGGMMAGRTGMAKPSGMMAGKPGGMGMAPTGAAPAVATPAGQEEAGMQPAKDVDDALNKARALLTGEAGKPDQNEMWNRVQRDRAMADQPGGPLMGMK